MKDDIKSSLIDLFNEDKELSCKLLSMRDSITIAWDNINYKLEKDLPADMPNAEKTNMLKSRNANLIRMFESFENVDDELKIALDSIELYDIKMAKMILTIRNKREQLEKQKLILFTELSDNNEKEALSEMRNLYHKILNKDCKSI
jgi:hypothetical protein